MKLLLKTNIIIGILFISSGCTKIKANRLDGTYECTFSSSGYSPSGSYDTTYQKDLIIESNDGILTTASYYGLEVPVNLLDKENCYSDGSSSSWQELCITHKTVKFTYGHQYQNSSGSSSYIGTREKNSLLQFAGVLFTPFMLQGRSRR